MDVAPGPAKGPINIVFAGLPNSFGYAARPAGRPSQPRLGSPTRPDPSVAVDCGAAGRFGSPASLAFSASLAERGMIVMGGAVTWPRESEPGDRQPDGVPGGQAR